MKALAPHLKKTRRDLPTSSTSIPPFSLPLTPKIAVKRFAALRHDGTSGCPYGEACHFAHYVPGGMAALAFPQAASLAGGLRKESTPPAKLLKLITRKQEETPSSFKSRLCSNFSTPEGCRYGEKCRFAHGEQELRSRGVGNVNAKGLDRFQVHFDDGLLDSKLALGCHQEPTPPGLGAAASFGAVSTAKVSIDASLAGIIIGKGGVNAKMIARTTGARISVKDHETDLKLKNVEMEGSLEQIKFASGMVRDLLAHTDVALGKQGGLVAHTYKSKLCDNFPRGSCKYGDRCHFAHGQGELRHAAPF